MAELPNARQPLPSQGFEKRPNLFLDTTDKPDLKKQQDKRTPHPSNGRNGASSDHALAPPAPGTALPAPAAAGMDTHVGLLRRQIESLEGSEGC